MINTAHKSSDAQIAQEFTQAISHLSQREAAALSGLSVGTIARLRGGGVDSVHPSTRRKMERYLAQVHAGVDRLQRLLDDVGRDLASAEDISMSLMLEDDDPENDGLLARQLVNEFDDVAISQALGLSEDEVARWRENTFSAHFSRNQRRAVTQYLREKGTLVTRADLRAAVQSLGRGPLAKPALQIGARLKQAREAKGLSRGELAEQLFGDIRSAALVEQWESGSSWPEMPVAFRLADALATPLTWLLDLHGSQNLSPGAGNPLAGTHVSYPDDYSLDRQGDPVVKDNLRYAKQLGMRIGYYREANRLDLPEVAKAVISSESREAVERVESWESGEEIPDTLAVLRLANLFEVPVAYLVTGDNGTYFPMSEARTRDLTVSYLIQEYTPALARRLAIYAQLRWEAAHQHKSKAQASEKIAEVLGFSTDEVQEFIEACGPHGHGRLRWALDYLDAEQARVEAMSQESVVGPAWAPGLGFRGHVPEEAPSSAEQDSTGDATDQ